MKDGVSAQKALQGFKTEMNDIAGRETKEKIIARSQSLVLLLLFLIVTQHTPKIK